MRALQNLLIVYHGFKTRGAGVKRHILQLSRVLREQGVAVQVLGLEDLSRFRYVPPAVQRLINLIRPPAGDYLRFWLTRRVYAMLLRRLRPLVSAVLFEDIYTNVVLPYPMLTVLHALQSDNLYQHGVDERIVRRAREWDRRVLRDVSGPVVTVSHEYRRHIADVVGQDAAARLVVVPLGIDVETFPETPAPRPSGTFRVAVLGNLEARKNPQFVLKIVARAVREGCRDLRLDFIGDGPLRRSLWRDAERLGLGGITTFLGQVPHEDIPGLLAQYHLLLHPSLTESFGYALVEAKLAGVRTIATQNLSVPPEFVDVALPLEADVWIGAVAAAYREWETGAFREPSAAALRGIREIFNVRRMVDAYLAILEGVTPTRTPDK